MPGVSTASLPRVDSAETLKTQVELQDISISPSFVTSMKLSCSGPMATGWQAGNLDGASDRIQHASNVGRKRNKSEVFNPTSPKRRWGDPFGDDAQLEGTLSIVERIEHAAAPHVSRTLGEIPCRLVTKNAHSWLVTVSDEHDMALHLQLDEMTVIHEPSQGQCVFALRNRVVVPTQPTVFVFTAPSPEECLRWVTALQAECLNGKSDQQDTRAQVDLKAEDKTVATSSRQGTKRTSLVYSIPPKITHVILVRHGHYVNAHVKGIADSHQVLSEMGRQQAKLTGEYLQQLYHRLPRHNHISIYHSDLTRAVETATGICSSFTNATPIASPLLREGWPGAPFFSDQMPAAFQQPSDAQQDELDRRDQERMEEAFTKFFVENPEEDQGSFRVVVCHANLIRYMLCRALRIAPQGLWGHFEINHCSVTRIDLARNRPLKVMTVNGMGHLPHSLVTSSEDHL